MSNLILICKEEKELKDEYNDAINCIEELFKDKLEEVENKELKKDLERLKERIKLISDENWYLVNENKRNEYVFDFAEKFDSIIDYVDEIEEGFWEVSYSDERVGLVNDKAKIIIKEANSIEFINSFLLKVEKLGCMLFNEEYPDFPVNEEDSYLLVYDKWGERVELPLNADSIDYLEEHSIFKIDNNKLYNYCHKSFEEGAYVGKIDERSDELPDGFLLYTNKDKKSGLIFKKEIVFAPEYLIDFIELETENLNFQVKQRGKTGVIVIDNAGKIILNSTCKFDTVNCVWIANDNLVVFEAIKEGIKSMHIYKVNSGEIKFSEIEYDIFKEVNAPFLNDYEILAFANSNINKSYILIDNNSFLNINKFIKNDNINNIYFLLFEFDGCDLDISLNKFVNECLYNLNEMEIYKPNKDRPNN